MSDQDVEDALNMEFVMGDMGVGMAEDILNTILPVDDSPGMFSSAEIASFRQQMKQKQQQLKSEKEAFIQQTKEKNKQKKSSCVVM